MQGEAVTVRSPQKVVNDIEYLNKKYKIRSFQFRDPTFGIQDDYIFQLCNELSRRSLKIQWGIETRPDLLNWRKIKAMFKVGLRNINIGIETNDVNIAKHNNRLLANLHRQERIISYCEKLGVKISAFYLFGFEGATKESMESLLCYAKKLNTFLARFAICTPYPGTSFFDHLEKQKRILTYDYEKYTQFNLVFKHNYLDRKSIHLMLSKAYKEYYFRPKYLLNLMRWKIREFWL